MFREKYGEAAVEVLDILDNTNKEDVKKIPQSFIKFLVQNASDDYVVNLDHTKTMSEMNIKEGTKELLGYIYINWWCDNNEKQQYKKRILEAQARKEEELRKRYDPNNIFKNKKNINLSDEIQEDSNYENETLAIVKYKENIIKRIISKVLNLFFKKS